MFCKNVRKIGYFRVDNRKYVKLSEKILRFIRKIFGKVKFENINNGTIILIPEYKKYSKFIIKKICKQIDINNKLNPLDYAIYEEKLNFFENELKIIKHLNGKLLMKNFLLEIFEYIFYLSNKNMNLEDVYLFINAYNKYNVHIIEKLVERFKTVNIITENLQYYRILEEKLYSQGILITVSNNKRKSVRNAKYIVNIDYESEKIEKFILNRNSIIINVMDENLNLPQNFAGVVVNNFEVDINKDMSDFINEFYGEFNKKIFLESFFVSNTMNKIEMNLEYKNIKIGGLIGQRGMLHKSEFYSNT